MVNLWRLQLFGGLIARQGEKVIARFPTQKTAALLAYLALARGKAIPREVLLDVLWPESDLSAARNSLSVALSSLRAQLEAPSVSPGSSPLGQVLIADRSFVQLSKEAIETDVSQFEELLKQGDATSLTAALDLYTGELLPGLSENWVVAERERLALSAENARARLAQLSGSTAIASIQPASAVGSVPLPLNRFFGRTEERATIRARLADTPAALLTITGPGGAGKTRLAIEAATDANNTHFEGGVWFLPLAHVTTASGLTEVIRNTLGLPREARTDPLEQLVEHLGERRTLLILDNIEQLLGRGPMDRHGAADVVRRMRSRLPNTAFLVTSRQALGLAGETELVLNMLPVPTETGLSPAQLLAFSSVHLFADRARNHRPDFQVTLRNADAVARLVGRLEGIPLALELAAAWAKLLSPAQMLARLEERFAFLVALRESVTERHRTLYAAIDWGYSLLSSEARRAFAALSVFRGSWTSDAAAEILESESGIIAPGRTRECLDQLRAASFLHAEEVGKELRFQLLESLREFAHEQLSTEERVRLEDRHALWFLGRAAGASARRNGPTLAADLDSLEADMPNFRVALHRASGQETELRLAATLGYFWKLRGHYREGRACLEKAISAGHGATHPSFGGALQAIGALADDMGDYAAAREYIQRAFDFYRAIGNINELANLTLNQGTIAYRQGQLKEAKTSYTEALALYRQQENTWGIASAVGNLGNIAQAEGDFTTARRHQEECLLLARQMGDLRMAAYTLHNLGNLSIAESDYTRARTYLEESLAEKRALGDRRGAASSLNQLGFLSLHEGKAEKAAPLFREALEVFRLLGNQVLMVIAIEGLARHASATGEPERALKLLAAVTAARIALNAPLSQEEQLEIETIHESLRTTLSADAYAHVIAEGECLSIEAASDLANSTLSAV